MLAKLLGLSHPPSLRAALYSDKVRVVVNALHAKSGGGVTYLRNILPLLAEDSRLELHIFLHQSQLALFHPLDERIIVHVFKFPPGLARLMLWEQAVMPVMAKVMSADLIFSPANFGSLLVGNQVILLRNALAVAQTETRWRKRLYWATLGLITFISLLRARKAIAVSNYAAKSLTKGTGDIFKDKITVIYHGVSDKFYHDANVSREDFLLAVSDIYVQKNFHTLFKSLQLIIKNNKNIKLVIAGKKIDAWYYRNIVELSRSLGIEDNIIFIGRVDSENLVKLYQSCKLFVFPSTAETFGNPLVEAMACGAPIATSMSSAMPEVVNGAALLFDPLDPEAMGATILRLLEDGALRQQISELGLARARDFSWHATAGKTAAVLIEAGART